MSRSVLIVDDDDAIRRLVALLLRRHSFDIEEATNGMEAIHRIRARRYDAIVLDLMMGPGSGFEVLDELRDLRPDDRCVVVLSASSERNLRAADGPNVSARLRKPFDVTELVREVCACCHHVET
jgi:DNA-binding response OmpR family regulator